jgi:aspartyl protease family protein
MRTSIRLALLSVATLAVAGPAAVGARGPATRPSAHAALANGRTVIDAEGRDAHEVARSSDGLFYVQARVNGRPVRFLVDTGASVVVLTRADAARLGVPLGGGAGGQIETAAGRTRMDWATLDAVELAGRDLGGVRAAVVQEGLGVSLLGQDVLSRLDAVTIEGDRLRLR